MNRLLVKYWFVAFLSNNIWCVSYNQQLDVSDNQFNGAFCQLNNYHHIFPLDPPDHRVPWVWDATESSDKQIVEVTIVSREACKFNYTEWKYLVKRFPQYRSQLGNGADTNILVQTLQDFKYFIPNGNSKDELSNKILQSHVTCTFLMNNERVDALKSLRIKDDPISELATALIKCPVPPRHVKWSHLRLDKVLNTGDVLSTAAFPVCRQTSNAGKFKLSVCTATGRSSRSHLVEWIEYHRLMGVNHFFIYDTTGSGTTTLRSHTAASPVSTSVSETLADYVWEGVVTVVRWPYRNCVLGMASGRWVAYSKEGEDKQEPRIDGDALVNRSQSRDSLDAGQSGRSRSYFTPPRAIAQTAALASCYSRFRGSSEWMIHIDDDEFLVFNKTITIPAKYGNGSTANGGPSPPAYVESLSQLIDQVAASNPYVTAIRFQPICVDDCRKKKLASRKNRDRSNSTRVLSEGVSTGTSSGTSTHSKPSLRNTLLPRLGTWRFGRFCPPYEGKLAINTKLVSMFFVHYLTLLEEIVGSQRRQRVMGDSLRKYSLDPFQLPREMGAVAHYKLASVVTGDIFGGHIPLPVLEYNQPVCLARRTKEENFQLIKARKQLYEFTTPLIGDVEHLYRQRTGILRI